MSASCEDIRTALQADAREHGVKLRLEADASLPDDAQEREQIAETALDAVHGALHGVALAQVDAGEVVVKVGPLHDHEVEVAASLKD